MFRVIHTVRNWDERTVPILGTVTLARIRPIFATDFELE
jgi:hypothetical protein